jgi:hypothetical protein
MVKQINGILEEIERAHQATGNFYFYSPHPQADDCTLLHSQHCESGVAEQVGIPP